MHTIWLQNWDYVYFKSLRNLSLNKDSSNCASPNVITCQQDEWYTLICQQFPIPVHISQTGQSLNRRHKLDTKNVNIQKQWENISISKNKLLLILKSQQFNTKRFEKKAPTWSCWNYLIHISLVVSLNVIGILSEKTCIGLCHIHSIFQYCRGIEIENFLPSHSFSFSSCLCWLTTTRSLLWTMMSSYTNLHSLYISCNFLAFCPTVYNVCLWKLTCVWYAVTNFMTCSVHPSDEMHCSPQKSICLNTFFPLGTTGVLSAMCRLSDKQHIMLNAL